MTKCFYFLQLWDIREGSCKQTFPGHESDINAVTVSKFYKVILTNPYSRAGCRAIIGRRKEKRIITVKLTCIRITNQNICNGSQNTIISFQFII